MTKTISQPGYIRTKKGTAANVSGKRTVGRLLSAARTEFARYGYNGMTMRGVAKSAGVSLGNLLYYFKSKQDLFHSLIEHTLANYVTTLKPVTAPYAADDKARFLAVMDFLIEDEKKASTRQFEYQLWAVSVENKFVNKCRRQFEEFLMERMGELVQSVNHSLKPAEIRRRAFILCGMVKGVSVMLGNGTKRASDLKGFESIFAEEAYHLATR